MEDIVKALNGRCGFEVVDGSSRPDQIRMLGRVPKNHQAFWLLVAQNILTVSAASGGKWSCDISKQLLLREGTIKYAWRLIIQAKNVATMNADIVKSILTAPRPANVQIEEMLLPGYKPGQSRNEYNESGRGAAEITKAVVGPMAMRGRR